MPDLKNRVAIVTGGSRGIGHAIAAALLTRGADVVVSGRDQTDLDGVAADLAGAFPEGGRVLGVRCDVRRPDDCRHLIEETVHTMGRLDILINNAGVGAFSPVETLEIEDWNRVIETNLGGVFFCSHYAIPHLREAGGGWIVNIGSLAGKNAFPGGAAYNASKFGLVGFTEALMQEVRHDGIRVSSIMPGSVATEFAGPNAGRGDEWKIQPEDLGQIVLDLLDTPARTLPSRIEVRPARPPKAG